jgi:peptide/nickel transport system substrate-binding protein
MADRIGQQLGNYRLVSLLGQGGYAEVYLGQHLRLNQQAAIKMLHTHLTTKEAEHFQQEAETIATLVHPAIVRVFDYDVQDGVPFLVMDYAPNGSLRRRHPAGEIVPLPQVVSSYVKQVADALQYEHKVVHRDIKPENMLVGRREEVLLSDFGIATVAHSTGSLSAEAAVGTIAYMAPEQIQGHPRPASDQYALGVTVYEWLCGERPFSGSFTELVTQHLWQPPPPLQGRAPAIAPAIEQVVLRALAKDPKERFATVAAFAAALEQASQEALLPAAPGAPGVLTEAVPPASRSAVPTELAISANASQLPTEYATPDDQAAALTPAPRPSFAPTEPIAAATPLPAEVPLLPTPALPVHRRRISRTTAALFIGLAVLVIAGGLGSLSLLAHFGVLGARSSAITPVRGGTWTDDLFVDLDSLLPNGSNNTWSAMVDQALYLPLFYGDAQGVIHPGAAREIPTVQNGGISADATTWTFHLRPHLVWSDGQPYDARDVDYTWKLWSNHKFAAGSTLGLNLISSTEVSADHLSITFHLKRPFAPFRAVLWVDGLFAPLPAHHFSMMAPEAILMSPDNLNPKVTSGPFMMAESVPGDHYTLVRNPKYYRTSEGLPYLDKVVFRPVDQDTLLKDLQAGSIDSSWFLDVSKVQAFQHLTNYRLVTSPTSAGFEGLFFNFHNVVLASHREVRQAIAMAIDHQALIQVARNGFATLLCTDHGSFYHPGYELYANCPTFDPVVANQLLDDNGWVKGPDGVRSKNGQRLEFEYSTTAGNAWRSDDEAILQRNFKEIGIKLDIHNYSAGQFFGPFLVEGKASPPTGAVAGRYDIAEFENTPSVGYDPDDSSLLSCDQIPPKSTGNLDFYCNPALDALYTQEQATADSGVRQQFFEQIHELYLTEFPFIVLFGALDLAMVHKGMHNYSPSPFAGETVNIWQWWCDKGKC